MTGVIGLTTALKIQEKGGYQVEIIAEVLPLDPKTIKYTSQWAVRTIPVLPVCLTYAHILCGDYVEFIRGLIMLVRRQKAPNKPVSH
jgi:hypothetical protein